MDIDTALRVVSFTNAANDSLSCDSIKAGSVRRSLDNDERAERSPERERHSEKTLRPSRCRKMAVKAVAQHGIRIALV